MTVRNRKAGADDGIGKRKPAVGPRVVVAEDQQSVVFQNSPTLLKHGTEFRGELFRANILDFFGVASRWAHFGERCWTELLPGKEKVSQLRVVDVVEERRIGNDQVNARIGQAGGCRAATREMNCALSGFARWPFSGHAAADGIAATINAPSGLARFVALKANFKRSSPIFDGS